jgi:hypothetical protein
VQIAWTIAASMPAHHKSPNVHQYCPPPCSAVSSARSIRRCARCSRARRRRSRSGRGHTAGHGDTLAEGRPGSRHPLSEARSDRSQSESVVATENPHADTKLSSAHGLTQEREGESLATGHSGSDRPLDEGR